MTADCRSPLDIEENGNGEKDNEGEKKRILSL